MDPAKLAAIRDWHPPSSVKGVCSFLSFANFYCKFIPNYSNIVAPIILLTCKDHPWSWAEPQQKAFDSLHAIFSSAPVLCIPDVSCPFSLMMDASLLAAGVVLMQPDASGDLHCYVFFSPRSLDLPSSLLTKTPKDSFTLYCPCLTLTPALSQSSSHPYPRTLLSMTDTSPPCPLSYTSSDTPEH